MIGDLIGRLGLREAALIVAAVGTAGILSALAFQYLGGYEPCALCYRQRWAYYLGIPAALLAAVLAGSRPGLSAGLLALVGLGFVLNTGFGVHHAGVEWGWWAGPAGCAGAGAMVSDARALLEALSRSAPVVPCDEAPFRILGLSMAGYNALLCAGLAVTAALGVRTWRESQPAPFDRQVGNSIWKKP